MNKEKVEKKINKKYGVNSLEIKDLKLKQIKDLRVKNIEKLKQTKKYKFIKRPLGTIVKGASIGTGVAGFVNTVFPDLVPVLGTYITTSSNLSNEFKLGALTFLSSYPASLSKSYLVLGVGASLGAVLYTGYKLVKVSSSNLKMINDRSKAKKLNR